MNRISSAVVHRIEVSKKGQDPQVEGLVRLMVEEGLPSKGLSIIRVYFLKTELAKSDVEKLVFELFADPVSEEVSFGRAVPAGMRALEVWYHPGVTDPESTWILTHLKRRSIAIEDVRRATRFIFPASVQRAKLVRFAERHLFNPLIQHLTLRGEEPFPHHHGIRFKQEFVKLEGLSDAELSELSQKSSWHFNLAELGAIKEHFRNKGREPSLIEIETIAQTWSEHCVHKTFNASFEMNGDKIENLLKDTIMQPSRDLNLPWCLSLFKDNSGVIEFTKESALSFKVETHNHPSAIEPYGGAATGIGGVIRDALGTGLGADPVFNTDVFCFGPPGFPTRKLPKGVLSPRTVLEGVVGGVRDYGNRMGIPTVAGAVYFDELYLANPLVFCGTVGLLPRDAIEKKVSKGDAIIVAGAKTGRDGIHGVTFASTALAGASQTKYGSAVQIGNPIEEKLLRDLIVEARDKGLISSITDCGGGGLSSAVGEMTKNHGCIVDLDRVPLKYSGLAPHEIWISESQERMLVFVKPEKANAFLELAVKIGIDATIIGEVTSDKILRLRFKGNEIASLGMDFLHNGLPQRKFKIKVPESKPQSDPEILQPKDLGQTLLRLLGQMNIASKEWVIRQYDHEVKGTTVLKPLAGIKADAPSDAAVMKPLLDEPLCVAVSHGIAPRYALIDSYWAAASAVDEAIRNLVAVGGRLDRIALLDNFCAGDADDARVLYEILRAALACRDATKNYGVPFISGKDSLNNFFTPGKDQKINIPTTLLCSALTLVRDSKSIISTDFKRARSKIYLLGMTRAELGGSEYMHLNMHLGASVPRVDMKSAKKRYAKLEKAMRAGLVLSAHDLSEGGVGVAVAEMCLGGEMGARIHLGSIPAAKEIKRNDYLLFSESQSRLLVEVSEKNASDFEKIMEGDVFASIGETTSEPRLILQEDGRRTIATVSVEEIRASWTQGLNRFLD